VRRAGKNSAEKWTRNRVSKSKPLMETTEKSQASAMRSGDQGSQAQSGAAQVAITAFVVLFCIVGLALWGLPFYYDFMVQQFGWTRAQVTSGNALSKLVVGPIFGFIAGWIIDRFGPRRVMMAGILMAGGALVGLGLVSTLGMFYHRRHRCSLPAADGPHHSSRRYSDSVSNHSSAR
jgi:uncharacterized membrane protein YeaQ/YmgE (transglycosylase-associated protein family)